MTSIIKVQNIQYTDGDAALTIADGGGVTAATTLAVTGDTSLKGNVVINEDSADKDFRVESNGNANMVFVDGGNDSVGIGISNPASYNQHADELVIGGTDGNRGVTIVGGDDDYSIINLNRSSNTSDTPNGAIEYNHTDNAMYIKANAISGIQIDNVGRVVKPYQPAFKVARATSVQTINNQVWTKVEFNYEYHDIGSNFDSSTNYRFTAPVAGMYLFCVAINYNNRSASGGYFYNALYKNGAIADGQAYLTGIRLDSSSYQESDSQFGGTTHLQLAANDYIEAYAYAHFNAGTGGLAMGGRTYMTGYLLG